MPFAFEWGCLTVVAASLVTMSDYPSRLQLLLGDPVEVQNFGRSGATMLSAGFGSSEPYNLDVQYTNATNFVSGAGADAVVTVVINLGANDSKPAVWEPEPGVKPKNDQQYLQDYRVMVDHFLGLPTSARRAFAAPPPSYGLRS